MILDAKHIFSEDQAETTQATHESDDIMDWGVTTKRVGPEALFLNVVVDTAITAAGGGTLQILLQQDSAVGFGTVETLIATKLFDAASGIASGTKLLCVQLPVEMKRYIRVAYVIASANMTAGSFNAFLSSVPQTA